MFERKGAKRRVGAFTLIDLLAIVLIILLLAVILVPTLQKARETFRDIGCKFNLHDVVFSDLAMYAADNKGWIPAAGRMGPENGHATYQEFLQGRAIGVDHRSQAGTQPSESVDTTAYSPSDDHRFRCPALPAERPWVGPDYWLNDFMASANDDSGASYGGRFKGNVDGPVDYWQYNIAKTRKLAMMYLAGEDDWQKKPYQNTDAVFRYGLWIGDKPTYPKTKLPSFPHPGKRTNVLFQDGHVVGMTLQEMRQAYAPDATSPSPRPLPWFNGQTFDEAAGFGKLQPGWNEADLLR